VPEFHYVSSVKGHLVTRFPSLRASTAQYIGAERKGKEIVWDTDVVVAISPQEWARYRREFRRAISDESLVERTEAEYKAYLESHEKAEQKAAEQRKADADAEAKKSQANVEPEPSPASEGASNQSKGKRANR
jgi:Sec-independent protein translocase protein TatA